VHNALENLPAIEQIIDFVEKHFSGQKATIAGHNVHFDVGFLKRLFEEEGIQYNQYFSHRLIDTASILNYLYFSGVLPDQLSSSDAAFKYFSISPVGRHTSLGDAVATAQLFNKLISFERKLRTRNLRIKPTGYPGKIGKSANKRSASNKAKLVQARP
jgi:DNA polymerase-3 subunit epsilon